MKVILERGSPDDLFVSKLAKGDPNDAIRLIEEARKDESFRKEIETTLLSGGRSNYIQICAPFELYALTRLLRPKHIVEVGVSAGVSSAYFLKALKRNGNGGILHSIDLPENETLQESKRRKASWALPTGKITGWAIPEHLRKDWDLKLGKSAYELPKVVREVRKVSIFLYDVPYTDQSAIADFGIVDQKISKGSIALADNCPVPITWWARKNKAKIYTRKNSGLRGFRID